MANTHAENTLVNSILDAVRHYTQPACDMRIEPLLPALTMDKIDYFIEQTRSMPECSVFRGAMHREYSFYYCHYNGQVYQVILDQNHRILNVSRPRMSLEF